MAKTRRGKPAPAAVTDDPKADAFAGYTAGWMNFDEPTISLAYWSGDQRMQHTYKSKWYFLMRGQDVTRRVEEEATGIEQDTHADGTPNGLVRVYVPYWDHDKTRLMLLDGLKEAGVPTFEGDLTPVERFMADKPPTISTMPKLLFYDLETDARAGWDKLDEHRVLSIAAATGITGEVRCRLAPSMSDEGERELLGRFVALVERHDTLVAWNGSEYDEVVLRARCKKLGISVPWRMVNFLDHLALFKRYYLRDAGSGVRMSFGLDKVGKIIVGEGKVQDVPSHKLWSIFDTPEGKAKIIKYNSGDVSLLQGIEAKQGYIAAHAQLAALCNRFLDDASLTSSNLVDGFVLKYSQPRGRRWPTNLRRKRDEDQGTIEGAFVMEPVLGMHEGVCDLDFSSLYPSIVLSFNIDPGTKVPTGEPGACTAANNVSFTLDREGIFPLIVKQALDSRQEYKDEAVRLEKEGKEGSHAHLAAKQRSEAWKVLANSMFGMLSSPDSRYYDPECGEAITVTGKGIIQHCIELTRGKGVEVVYGDTDSFFARCSASVAAELSAMAVDSVAEWVKQRGGQPGFIKLKLDAEFKRIFFTAKKRYAGLKSTGVVDIRGLEMVRTDNCAMARELQREITEYLLRAPSPSATVAERIIQGYADKLFTGSASKDELVLAQSLEREIDSYKVKPVHVRIAEQLLQEGREVYVGMRIAYMLTGEGKGGQQGVFVEDSDGTYDAKLYWGKVYPPTQRIVEAVFPKDEQKWAMLEDGHLNPSPQADLFQKPQETAPVELRLQTEDQDKLERLREVVARYPGARRLKLVVRVEGAEVALVSDLRCRLCKELVVDVEEVVGRKVYYGADRWDKEAACRS